MTSKESKCSCFCYCCCNKSFWNSFCKPRYPGIHIILLIILLNLIYTCIYVLMSVYYDTFSGIQHVGYVLLLIGNVAVTVIALLGMHFLSQKPEELKLSYCIFLHIASIIVIALGSCAVFVMLLQPTPSEIVRYAKRYIRIYSRAPYMVQQLFIEKKCCGIQKYKDVFSVYTDNTVKYYRIPPSCCKRESKGALKSCMNWLTQTISEAVFDTSHENYLYQKPCLKKGEDFSAIMSTNTYETYLHTVQGMGAIFAKILVILIVLNYYIWYRFSRITPEARRPTQFNTDIRLFVTCRWIKLRRRLKARKKSDDESALRGQQKHAKSNFTMRHELIQQSIASMRVENRDNLEAKDKEKKLRASIDEQILASRGSTEEKMGSSALLSPADSAQSTKRVKSKKSILKSKGKK